MISITDSMLYRLDILNKESSRISYQTSTGKILENGSDDSVLYSRELFVSDKIRMYDGLVTQIEKTNSQNSVADATVTDIKSAIDSIKQEVLKASSTTSADESRKAIATNVAGIKDRLLDLVNTSAEGEYLFSGSNSTIRPFEKNEDTGEVDYVGNGTLRKVAVDVNTYRQRGITGLDVVMYDTDNSISDGTISFKPTETIVDSEGLIWTPKTTVAGGVTNYSIVQLDPHGVETGKTELASYSDGTYSVHVDSGSVLYVKHNFFDDIDEVITAMNNNDTAAISAMSEAVNAAYDQANIAQAELGGRNKIFEVSLESAKTKRTHFEIMLQEVGGSDLSKLAVESKALEMQYAALYSVISKMNETSILNYIN